MEKLEKIVGGLYIKINLKVTGKTGKFGCFLK